MLVLSAIEKTNIHLNSVLNIKENELDEYFRSNNPNKWIEFLNSHGLDSVEKLHLIIGDKNEEISPKENDSSDYTIIKSEQHKKGMRNFNYATMDLRNRKDGITHI